MPNKVEVANRVVQTAISCIENRVEGRRIDSGVDLPGNLHELMALVVVFTEADATLAEAFNEDPTIILDKLRMQVLEATI
jgi:hypothetical protein